MSEVESGRGSASGEAGRGRVEPWSILAVLSLSGAASLLLVPSLASRILSSGIWDEERTERGSWAPDVHLSRLVDVVASLPPSEGAFLIGRAGAFSSTSFEGLHHRASSYPVYGIWRDPTVPHGYRFHSGDGSQGSETLALPEQVRFLIVPDPDVAALLDPALFHTEQREVAPGRSVTIAHIHGGSVLELRTHGDRLRIGQRPAEHPTAAPPDVSRLRVLAARQTGQITGPLSPNDTGARWDVYGTDLGSVFWHGDRLYIAFGDTFGQGSRWEGRNWRSNTMARLAPPGPAPDVLFIDQMVSGRYGFAREVLPSRKIDGVEMTVLPTSGISTGDRMFLHYMSVERWLESGHWVVGHSGIAYSDDDGMTFLRPSRATWQEVIGFEQAALVRSAGWIYSFGIPGGRYGGVRLRRVEEAGILEADAYEYWDGSDWVAEPERAALLIDAPVGQLSVAWNPYYRAWMMMYLMPSVDAVVLRLAPELVGPWSDWQFVVRGQDYPGLYAPYIVPLPETGQDVWFTMSKWWPYNVFLMRMTLGDPDSRPITVPLEPWSIVLDPLAPGR